MTPVEPIKPANMDARAVTIAANQPQYNPLPALVEPDGTVHTRWQLTDEERAAIAAGADLMLSVLTFRQPLQPVIMGVAGVDD